MKIMQNLVVLIDPPVYEDDISLKAGKMCLNRFCIDEDAAFELSGVYDLKQTNKEVTGKIIKIILGRGVISLRVKGK